MTPFEAAQAQIRDYDPQPLSPEQAVTVSAALWAGTSTAAAGEAA